MFDVFLHDFYLKVLSRLAVSTKKSLRVGEVATPDQVKQLIYNVTHSKFNNRNQSWGGVWGKHAIFCMFEDLVEGSENVHTFSHTFG